MAATVPSHCHRTLHGRNVSSIRLWWPSLGQPTQPPCRLAPRASVVLAAAEPDACYPMPHETHPPPSLLTAALCALFTAPLGAQQLDSMIEQDCPSLVATYKQLHAAPELSQHKEKTSALVGRGCASSAIR